MVFVVDGGAPGVGVDAGGVVFCLLFHCFCRGCGVGFTFAVFSVAPVVVVNVLGLSSF